MTAPPTWSRASCTANPPQPPRPTVAVAFARMASRAGTLIPFPPTRSRMRRSAAASQDPASARSGTAASIP